MTCGLAKNFTQLFAARMAVGAGEAGLAPPAYSIITDSFRPQHFGYAMAFYKSAVKVGGALALILGGVLIDFYTKMGAIELPIIGTIHPWQATLMTVGFPGLLLAMLISTCQTMQVTWCRLLMVDSKLCANAMNLTAHTSNHI